MTRRSRATYTMGQRIRTLVVVCVLVLMALGAWQGRRYLRERLRAPIEPRLAATQRLPTRDWALGSFRIAWDADLGRLTVAHADAPDHPIWATRPDRGFLTAAAGKETVAERRGLFRVTDRLANTWAEQTFSEATREESRLTFAGTMADAAHTQVPYTLTFEAKGADTLRFEATVDAPEVNRLFLTYASDAEEAFYGFGEQFTHINLKGHRVPVLVSEQGIGRGAQPITFLLDLVAGAGGDAFTTYIAVPQYLTSNLRSLCLETYAYNVFDLRRDNEVQVKVFANHVAGRIFHGNTPAELIQAYTAFAGRMRPLPGWILDGAVVGMQGGTGRVRRIHDKLRANDTPIAAFWLQDWCGQRTTIMGKQLWWNWELDRERYPEWDALRDDFAQDGVRLMTYVNPFLADVSRKTNARRNLFREAAEKGYLIKNPEGGHYLIQNTSFSAGMLDLTNPEARTWMKDVIMQNVVGVGASGWMADYGEALPFDAVLHSGVPAAEYHNQYPEAWARLNRDVADAASEHALTFFMRSAYTHSPAHSTLFWEGDQTVTWDKHDGMKSAVTGLLSGGMSGFAFNHSDIGGYAGGSTPVRDYFRSKELLLRWMEMNAFTTIYRTHEGVTPDENAQFYDDAETLAHFARFAKVYKAWGFYRKQLVHEAAETGLPVVRHPFIHYPKDEAVRDISFTQFLVGDAFMVAPVLDPDNDELLVYLPAGGWRHLWSGEAFGSTEHGQEVIAPAPLGEPAVFYRADTEAGPRFRENLRTAGLVE